MSDTPPEFDLKFLPDWLKESSDTQKYANYEGPSTRERSGGRGGPGGDRGERRGPRPGGPGGPGGPRPGGARPGAPAGRGPGGPAGRDSRGPRPGGPASGPNRGPRRDGPAGDRDRGPRRDDREREPRPAPTPQVRIEFIPDPNGAQSIAKQIKTSGRAYPLFGTGRLFLERPERHRVRLTSLDANVPLQQFGDGPVSFDKAAVERQAFFTARSEYYKEEIVEGEPIKGNFKNVARIRGGGPFLGPTNYHSYQPSLRRIYEERYSRRMSFGEFQQSEVQVLSDEQSINDWKEQARSSTTYVTLKEETPIVFKTVPEVETHFRQHYLPQLVNSGVTLECSGQASRELPDRNISMSVRDAWERERGFPVNLVNHLRPYLMEQGLHFFKHRKRILYISAIKPLRHVTGQAISSGIEAILKAVEEHPRCTRRDLALRILGANADAPEMAEQKAALARDFHYLAHAGHVLEFHDGAIDLPLPPGGAGPQKAGGGKAERGDDLADAERDAERAALAETQPRQPVGKITEPPRRDRPPAQPQRPAPRLPQTAPEGAALTESEGVVSPAEDPVPSTSEDFSDAAAEEHLVSEVPSAMAGGREAEPWGADEDAPTEPLPESSPDETLAVAPEDPASEAPRLTSLNNEVVAASAEHSRAAGSPSSEAPVLTTSQPMHFSSFEQLSQSLAPEGEQGKIVSLAAGAEHTEVTEGLQEASSTEEPSLPPMQFLESEAGASASDRAEIVDLSAPEPKTES